MTDKTRTWLLFVGFFAYLVGIGATFSYYESDSVDPVATCKGESKEEIFLPIGTMWEKTSAYEECIDKHTDDLGLEVIGAFIWPITLPITLGMEAL